MSSANKRRGTTFERAIEGYLLEEGTICDQTPPRWEPGHR